LFIQSAPETQLVYLRPPRPEKQCKKTACFGDSWSEGKPKNRLLIKGGFMKQNVRTGWLAVGLGALLSFAALIYYLFSHQTKLAGIDSGDAGGAVLAALIVWLALRGNKPLEPKTRILLGAFVGVGMLVGLAIYFMA
jgi:hypothetical protein